MVMREGKRTAEVVYDMYKAPKNSIQTQLYCNLKRLGRQYQLLSVRLKISPESYL